LCRTPAAHADRERDTGEVAIRGFSADLVEAPVRAGRPDYVKPALATLEDWQATPAHFNTRPTRSGALAVGLFDHRVTGQQQQTHSLAVPDAVQPPVMAKEWSLLTSKYQWGGDHLFSAA
jgi:hypothetical protein